MRVLVTGSSGLIGSEAVTFFDRLDFAVTGVDNNMRADFFGPRGDTTWNRRRLETACRHFTHHTVDIRDRGAVDELLRAGKFELIIHAAAQPSHDLAAKRPFDDFDVNAVGTLNLLEALRAVKPDVPFIFMSTNKVYGDRPNGLPLEQLGERLELPDDHRYFGGIDTSMSIDGSMHSLFGVSKASADLMVQEYGRYFQIPTVCFRGGCLTGPSHAGAQLHGFLSYLMRCTVTGERYTVFGHDGLQVRDNLHSHDVVTAMQAFHTAPRVAAVYNLGGGRASNCSMREAIAACERVANRELDWELSGQARMGDHRWWISDLSEWERDYPDWRLEYDLETTLREIHDHNVEHWMSLAR
jgi:CDP-paratose 2-epimerase